MFLKILKLLCFFVIQQANLLMAQSLVFEEMVQQVTLAPGQRYVQFSYSFTNEGQNIIKIGKVEMTCGCSSYALVKEIFSPGESGVMTVKVDTLGKSNKAFAGIAIATDEKDGMYMLEGHITIPSYITVIPSMLRWDLGDELKEKRFAVEMKTRDKNRTSLQIKDIIVNKEYFDVRVEPIEAGKSFFVYVRPRQKMACSDQIKIVTKPEASAEGLSVIAYVGEKHDHL